MTSEVMSNEDFRAHLYRSLQERGILNSLKSQLRNKLAAALHKAKGDVPIGSSPQSQPKSMRVQIADSIVAEYLQCAGYEYSLSIFLPEADISVDKLFCEEDLIRFLRIPPSSDIYKYLRSHQKPEDFLERLLEALIESCNADTTAPSTIPSPPVEIPPLPSAESQASPPIKSVADRLEELDMSYARRAEEESMKSHLSLESRLEAFQRELEARYKQQLESELALHRNREIARARQEERDRCREELSKEKEDLYRTHRLRLEEVRKSEQNMIEKYHRKEQELEAGIYAQRQTLLDELNALRVKEAGLKRQLELDKRALTLEHERARTKTEQLETSMDQLKARFELMAEEKIQKGRMEYELELQSKHSELGKWEAQLKMDAEKTDLLKLENRKLTSELSEQRRTVDKLQTQLHEVTWREIGLEKQKDETRSKLGEFNDYHHLKMKVVELKQQLSLSESKLAELKASHKHQQHTIKQLQDKVAQPLLEQVSLQAEVDQLRKTHHREMLVFEHDNKQLGRKLAAQTEHSFHLQKRLDEQLVQLRSAQREVQDLHTLLEQHVYTYGNRGSQRATQGNGKVSKSSQSSPKKMFYSAKPSSLSMQHQTTKLVSPQPPLASFFKEDFTSAADLTTTLDPKKRRNTSFFDSSGKFLAESRATISRMEKEAEQLERTYRDFNYHVLNNAHGDDTKHALLPLQSGPSPLSPDLDISLLSQFDQSSISTVATPTTLFQPAPPTLHYSTAAQSQPAGLPSHAGPPQPTSTAAQLQPAGLPSHVTPPQPTSTGAQPQPAGHAGPPQPTSTAAQPQPAGLPSHAAAPPHSSTAPLHYSTASQPQAAELPSHAVPPPHSTTAAQLQPAVLPAPIASLAVGATAIGDMSSASSWPTFRVSSASTVIRSLSSSSSSSGVVSTTMVVPLSASITVAQPRSSMSLDNWWKASEPFSVKTVPTSKTPDIGHQSDGNVARTSTATLPMTVLVSATNSQSVSETSTGTFQTPVLSLAPGTTVGHSSIAETRLTSTVGRSSVAETRLTSTVGRSSVAETRLTSTLQAPVPSVTPEMTIEHSSVAETRLASALQTSVPSVTPEMTVGHSSEVESLGESGKKAGTTIRHTESGHEPKGKSSGTDGGPAGGNNSGKEDGVDPVMLKYMQLVTERRQNQDTQLKTRTGSHAPNFDAPPLSRDVSSFDGFSNHEDDPFEDW